MNARLRLALGVSLSLFLLLPALAEDSTQVPDPWRNVAGPDESALQAVSIHRIGSHVYALGGTELADGNRPVWVLQAGKAAPVLAPTGEQLALVELCEMTSAAVGSSRSDSAYSVWRVEGAVATPVKGRDGQPFRASQPVTRSITGQPGSPYYFPEAVSTRGFPPKPPEVGAQLLWFSGDSIRPVELPELRSPRAAWSGTKLIITSGEKTWIVRDGKPQELLSDKGEAVYPDTTYANVSASQDCFAFGNRQLFHIRRGRAVSVTLPPMLSDLRLFNVGDEVFVWLRERMPEPVQGGMVSPGHKVISRVQRLVNGRLRNLSAVTDARAPVVAVGLGLSDTLRDTSLYAYRGTTASKVTGPVGQEWRLARVISGPGADHVAVFSQLQPGTPRGIRLFTFRLFVVDERNNFTEVRHPGTKSADDIAAGEDGVYVIRSGDLPEVVFIPSP